MPTISIDLSQLGPELRRFERRLPKAVERGLVAAAHRGRRLMVRRHSEGRYPVYLGQMKNSWVVKQIQGGALLVNDAPHAGIIEEGARPHKVSREGQEAIFRWALKKLGGGLAMADRAVARKQARESGQLISSPDRRGMRKAEKEDALVREARSFAWNIVKKINREGQQGLFILKKALPLIEKYIGEEVGRALQKLGEGPVSGPNRNDRGDRGSDL